MDTYENAPSIDAKSKPIWDDNHVVDMEYECPKCHTKWSLEDTEWLRGIKLGETFHCTNCGTNLKKI